MRRVVAGSGGRGLGVKGRRQGIGDRQGVGAAASRPVVANAYRAIVAVTGLAESHMERRLLSVSDYRAAVVSPEMCAGPVRAGPRRACREGFSTDRAGRRGDWLCGAWVGVRISALGWGPWQTVLLLRWAAGAWSASIAQVA